MRIQKNNNYSKGKKNNFTSYLLRSDEVAIILKSHLYLEQEIDSLIEKITPNPKFILKKSFSEKLDFLNALNIISNESESKLRGLNSIRNKFSHQYGYELSAKDLKFFKSIGARKELDIPKSLRSFPKIKETIIISRAIGFLSGYLCARKDIHKKIFIIPDREMISKITKRVDKKHSKNLKVS